MGRCCERVATKMLLLLSYCALSMTLDQAPKAEVTYLGAVVEFAPSGNPAVDPPSVIVDLNLASYENITRQNQGVDIIVYPEYGITTLAAAVSRDFARAVSQLVPDPSERTNPCLDDLRDPENEVARRVSCMARDSEIYVVINVVERVPCDLCTPDDLLIYNTNAAFDRDGILIARYRKYRPFGEPAVNASTDPEHSTFTTDFGAIFGLFTAFDILYESPAVELVQDYGVTDVVYPNAWFQTLPFLTSFQIQSAWSTTMGVNLLGSSYNNPERGATGSAIYQSGSILESFTSDDPSIMTLVANISTTVNNIRNYENMKKYTTKNNKETLKFTEMVTPTKITFGKENFTNYYGAKLPSTLTINDFTFYYNTISCNVVYALQSLPETFHYMLLMFDGVKTYPPSYEATSQVCAVVACSDDNLETCGDDLDSTSYTLDTTFDYLEINGNFSTSRILGNTLSSDTLRTLQDVTFAIEDRSAMLKINNPLNAIHTFGVYAHDFKDES